MAADRQSTIGGIYGGSVTKIARRDDGALIGISGDAGLGSRFKRWFLAGENGDAPTLNADADNYAIAIVVRPDGSIEEHGRFGWATIEGQFVAYGSGLEAAIAAMHMGADAARAVEIASLIVNGCGGGVDVVSLADGLRVAAE